MLYSNFQWQIALFSYLIDLWWPVTGCEGMAWGCQGRFRLDNKKSFFLVGKWTGQWSQLSSADLCPSSGNVGVGLPALCALRPSPYSWFDLLISYRNLKNAIKNKSKNSSVCKGEVLKGKDFLEPLYILCSVSTLHILTKQSLTEISCNIEFYLSWKHHSNTKQRPQDQKGDILHKTTVLI